MNRRPELETEARPRFDTSYERSNVVIAWRDARGDHRVAIHEQALVGSSTTATIQVVDRAVSKLHAELTLKDDGVWIRDLQSRNGTFVHDCLVREARVPWSAAITVGDTQLRLEAPRTTSRVELWPDEHYGALWGASRSMRELFARLDTIARTEMTVLVQGETGTGKELVARAVHDASGRRDGPYVVVDCGALPENLLESELFGHAKGAFTGAIGARAGAFEQASGGTLFLDEVGELTPAMQPKLLRALESRTIRRVGENGSRNIDVRFVAATHRDLREMVNSGGFREDLYFRLSVAPVRVPPLRERLDDLALLASKVLPGVTPTFDILHLEEMKQRPWLGNVRELRSFVERVVALGYQGAAQEPALPHPRTGGPAFALPPVPTDLPFKELREAWTDHLEREYVSALLAEHRRNITAVAEAAGLDRAYVYRLMKKHDL